ncbi:hypothetical protein BDV36DRAFT_308086 [Aspergillus pseudocaelatus]|uniref:Choline monooxygenase, chloroplastic n=1 Tax=Aspergillus pseudocaelatus TaxID=1825620 RepID=A0ABQ6WPX5_9EURO|nr:hypothetical protein BDV36DRAFT_308086 [Aspergillus pseudocaelatus]
MASVLKNFLGFQAATNDSNVCPVSPEKTPVRALPAIWYTSPELYELERRAIFSKKWLLTTHILRFPNTGSWSRYNNAGYPFILVRGQGQDIKAFHDIWSDAFSDEIVQTLVSEDTKFRSFHVHLDANGFIWINMDAGKRPEISWEKDFKGIDEQPRFKDFNFEDYVFDHAWEMDGPYNWKILADNYNECYHCQTAHPDVPSLADLEAYAVDTVDGSIIHFANAKPDQVERGLKIASTYYFPNSSMTVTPHFFFMQRFVPTSPTNCEMRYEVYRNKNSSEEDFQLINGMYKRIMAEDKYLCTEAQKNIGRGVFVSGLLHPRMEKGPLYFQGVVRDLLYEHFDREKDAGKQIWPAQLDNFLPLS